MLELEVEFLPRADYLKRLCSRGWEPHVRNHALDWILKGLSEWESSCGCQRSRRCKIKNTGTGIGEDFVCSSAKKVGKYIEEHAAAKEKMSLFSLASWTRRCLEKLIATSVRIPQAVMNKLVEDEAHLEKKIDEMKVNDEKNLALSLLLESVMNPTQPLHPITNLFGTNDAEITSENGASL
ncbi:hypothetical protein Bca52824_011399 [Brassica carinata]|uniref:Uncharacterized protein n=1 Tax=Brassica carinata TaxID=52824 RepID=A0A8X7WFC6_BRACI|nr:hypothetical protein Bca52824_011399 [Brassica carinata]